MVISQSSAALARKEIEAAVAALENETHVEIVPVYVEEASRYAIVYAIAGSLWGASLVPFFEGTLQRTFLSEAVWLSPLQSLLLSGAAIALALITAAASVALAQWKPLRFAFICLIPRFLKMKAVEKCAQDFFLKHEVFATQNRSGLLVLICEKEKLVYLLADRGLTAVIEESVWARLGMSLAQDLSKKGASHSFLAAMTELKPLLVKHFPAGAKNTNELSDELRT